MWNISKKSSLGKARARYISDHLNGRDLGNPSNGTRASPTDRMGFGFEFHRYIDVNYNAL